MVKLLAKEIGKPYLTALAHTSGSVQIALHLRDGKEIPCNGVYLAHTQDAQSKSRGERYLKIHSRRSRTRNGSGATGFSSYVETTSSIAVGGRSAMAFDSLASRSLTESKGVESLATT